jgi:nitrogen-specific signal transduction histidine kinase
MLKVAIRDNGSSIAPDMFSKLTRECVSTKEDGSGLGLLIAREIMESHRGDLKIATRREGGAEVSTWLPILTAPGNKTEAAV